MMPSSFETSTRRACIDACTKCSLPAVYTAILHTSTPQDSCPRSRRAAYRALPRMPAEALTKGPAPTRRSAPSAQKTASAARSISRPQHDDWAAAAPESGEEWTSEPQSAVVAPRARPALPGTQSEEFEYLFHLEKTEPAVATAPKAAGWDEGLERLSIVTLCPTEESWERLRAWIEMYSAQESRRPWICPKAEPLATTDATPAPATPSVSAPPSQKPFDFKASLARGDFPPLSRGQQLAALESADKTSEPKAVPEKSAPSKPEAGTVCRSPLHVRRPLPQLTHRVGCR